MKFSVFFALIICVLTSNAFAESHIFTREQRVTKTEFPCLWATDSCDTDEMGGKLIEECFNSGYEGCTIVNNSVRQVKFTQNTMCGWERKAVCIVQVKGKK